MSNHKACVEGTMSALARSATAREALKLVIEWWEAIPARLQQDIEGSGAEPGCVARARRVLAE